MNRSLAIRERTSASAPKLLAAAGVAAALIGSAIFNKITAHRAERRYPPRGRFIEVDGVRLHVLDAGGAGAPVVLLHGNGANFVDMELSGLVSALGAHHRVIAFDRPGFGHSDRPREITWTPEAQADLIAQALDKLDVGPAIVLGHSWSTLVALSLALRHPERAKSLILISGYYFPTARLDIALMAPAAIPVVTDIISDTVSPLLARLIARRAINKMFAPLKPPPRFWRLFPLAFAFRPSQVRAAAQETMTMVFDANRLQADYAQLTLPVTIIAGAQDQIIDPAQSAALHQIIAGSALKLIPHCGHMAHYFANELVVEAANR